MTRSDAGRQLRGKGEGRRNGLQPWDFWSRPTPDQKTRRAMPSFASPRVLRYVAGFFFAAMILFILSSQFLNVFVVPLCCADDEAMAVVAKNFAFGNGYAMSAHYTGNPGLYPFDPGITTGPTLLIPASLLIRLFGNLPWVPGLTTSLAIILLSLCIAGLITRYESGLKALIFTAVLLLIANSLIGPYAWASILGELPAALCAIVAMILWSRHPDSTRTLALASFVFGLAALTKLLATLSYAPVGMWLTYVLLTRPNKAETLKHMILSVCCFAIPLACFELFKLVSMGPTEYFGLLRQLASFVTHMAAPGESVGAWSKIASNLDSFATSYKILSPLLIAIELAGLVLVLTANDMPADAKRRYYLFAAAAGLNWLWFLAASVGWPRYMSMGLVFDAAAIATLASAFYRNRLAAFALVALLMHLPTPLANLARSREVFSVLGTKNERVSHLEAAADFVKTLPKEAVLVGGWWPSISGLEFMLPGADHFTQFDHLGAERFGAPIFLVRNVNWTQGKYASPEFSQWESMCSEVIFDQPPYLISRCPAGGDAAAKNLKTASENIVSGVTPAPRLRAVAGGWDLFAHAPTTMRLPIQKGAQKLVVGFGMDSVTWKPGEPLQTDGVCFVVDAVDTAKASQEIMRKCLSPFDHVADRNEQEMTLVLPLGSESILLKTESVVTTYWDWSHWSKLQFE